MDIVPVQPQEETRGLKACPLIPIDKWVVFDNGMTKGSGFAEYVRIEVLAPE
ncbi:MAG: hypothetical protein AAB222_08790 [Candidatus Binatota bacterium]